MPRKICKMYKFYRLIKEKKLFSFGDLVRLVPVNGMTLEQTQNEAIRLNGHEVKDIVDVKEIKDESYFIFDEDLFFTSDFVRQAIRVAQGSSASIKFSLDPNSFNERFVLPHSKKDEENYQFNFYYINHADYKNVQTFRIIQKIYPHQFKLPRQIIKTGYISYDQCETFITRLASPFHLLHLNLAVNLNRTLVLQKLIPNWLKTRFGSDNSKLYFFALKRLIRIGKGCKIHRSAIIEGSIIGDNVTIGANCVVRLSRIDSGSILEDQVSVCHSILGKNNYISTGNIINLCMSYDDVFLIHGPYQFSIFGKNVATMAVINCDFRLDQADIMIPTDEGLINSRQSLLGIAYGHNVVIGGGNIIAPGRIVPNQKKISPPKSIIITKFDE